MQVRHERQGLNPAFYASLFVCLASGSIGVGYVLIDSAFRESPATASCAYQEKLHRAILQSVADSSHMEAIAFRAQAKRGSPAGLER